MQVMDFVGREDLVERGMATITAPRVLLLGTIGLHGAVLIYK